MNSIKTLTFDYAYKLFKEVLASQKLSSATILAYSIDLRQFRRFLKEKGIDDLNQVNPEILLAFQKQSKKKVSGASLARKNSTLRRFFHFLPETKLLKNNFSFNLNTPSFSRSNPRILSAMEYRALRDACRHSLRMLALVEVFLQTGLKVGEVANLTLADCKHHKLLVKKNQKLTAREVPLNKAAYAALKNYLKIRPKSGSQNLFVTKNGTPLRVRNMTTILMRCFEQAEIKNASLSALRHTWISYQLQHGVPLETVSRLAGHKHLGTTAAYLNLIKKKTDKVRTRLKDL